MRAGIMASLYHTLMIDDETERHQYCPSNSWCAYKRGLPVQESPHHLHSDFKEVLLPVYTYYTQPALLRRMVPGMNTNLLESYNSILWSILPKSKFHGTRKTEIAVMISIFWQQEGKKSIETLMNKLDLQVSESSLGYFNKLDEKGNKQKTKRKSDSSERFQKRLKSALERHDEQQKSYHPGVCDAGTGPSSEDLSTPSVNRADEEVVIEEKKTFVVLPYGPVWYFARVEKLLPETKEILVDFLYENDDGTYSHT